jgi:signal transduction histidine kinase
MLLEGRALTAAYRGLRSRMALMEPFAVERPAGRQLISLPIRDDEHTARGVLQVLTDQEPPVKVLETLEALTHVIAQMLRQTRLNGELQHSLNQLFLVHQVGREFNLATSLDAVLIQVRDQLAGTLNFHHCCVLLLHDRRHLLPEAGIGIDPRWVEQARPALERSVARRVLESGVAEQVSDPVTLADLDLPTLEDGTPPAAVLCAPLSTRMGIIGFIELYTSTLYAFTADEVFLLSVLATEVATAVENAQLYESLREKEERLTTLAHKLIHSQEEERRRIARDMHDGLAQLIVSAFQLLQAHAYTVPQSADRKPLDRGLAMLADCIDESRKVIFDLRPATLDDFGLVLALRQYLSTLESELGWQTEFSLVGHIGALSPAMEIAIFRLVQEALTNVRKHARTMKVLVRLACTPTTLVITVRDWGCGFDVQEAAHRNGHLGLTGMKERVALLHGDFHLRSRPGAGTLVRITIPLE